MVREAATFQDHHLPPLRGGYRDQPASWTVIQSLYEAALAKAQKQARKAQEKKAKR